MYTQPLIKRHHLKYYGILVKNLPAMPETWVWSLGWEDPLEKGKATHSSILAWRIPTVDGVVKSQTGLRDFHFHFSLWNINMTILQILPPVSSAGRSSTQFPFSSALDYFPGGSDGQESACNAGNRASILGWGRSTGGNGNPLQYSCLENSLDRGAWPAPVQRVTKSQTWLSD